MWKIRNINAYGVNILYIFYVIFDYLKIRRKCNFACDYHNTWIIQLDKVNQNFRFGILQVPIHIGYMLVTFFHEFCSIVVIHRNNNLFSWRFFYSYLDLWFWFRTTFNNILDLINFPNTNNRKCVFDFDDFCCCRSWFSNLCIWSLN